MNPRSAWASFLLLALLVGPAVRAEPAANVATEINSLLDYIETSGCEFNRNGVWYDSKDARTHLDEKYKFLATLGMISSAEDFIEKAATESTFSGKPYEVKCNGGPIVMSRQWLKEELARLRARLSWKIGHD